MGVFDKAVFVRVLEAGSAFTLGQVRALGDALEAVLGERRIYTEASYAAPSNQPTPPRTQ